MLKIGLTGYYGMSNYGDDLFAIASYLAAKKYWTDCRPYIISAPLVGFDAAYCTAPFIRKKLLSRNDMGGKIARLGNLAWSSLATSKMVFSGGSLFTTGHIDTRDFVYLLKRGKKGYFSAIGVSVGPFKDLAAERKIRERLSHFEYIAVRDKISYERLASFDLNAKIIQAADLVGVMPVIFPDFFKPFNEENIDKGILKIGFSPCHLVGAQTEAISYCDHFVSFVTGLVRTTPVDIKIICLNQHEEVGDVYLCTYVQKQLSHRGLESNLCFYQAYGALATWKVISELDAYFSVRLHGAITAFLSGTPFFLFEYHEKCTEFLDFIGKPEVERIPRGFLGGGDFKMAFDRVLDGRGQHVMSPHSFTELSVKNFTESPFCVGNHG